MTRARLTIDLDAIGANWRLLRDMAAPAEVGAVVKADAYALGAEPVARRLWAEGCRTFFVARLDEEWPSAGSCPTPRYGYWTVARWTIRGRSSKRASFRYSTRPRTRSPGVRVVAAGRR